MSSILLAIDLSDSKSPTHGNQRRQRNFRTIGGAVKHRFAKYSLTHSDKIKSPDQMTIHPCFHTVRDTSVM